jgi:hypothetical protein
MCKTTHFSTDWLRLTDDRWLGESFGNNLIQQEKTFIHFLSLIPTSLVIIIIIHSFRFSHQTPKSKLLMVSQYACEHEPFRCCCR